jgi:lambda repressor-like predicted transcriptional regulator
MIELLKIPEKEYQKLNQALEQYKTEREQLEEAYRARSKELTKEIHKIEDRIARDKRIRERRGPEYMQYRNKQMFEMHKNGTSYENLAQEFKISKLTVKNIIERIIRFENIIKLKEHLKKTEGIVNDTLPIEVLMWHASREMTALNRHNIKTVGDYYKMKDKVKLKNSVIDAVEHEIEWASKRYFNDLKRKARGDFYYGKY